MKKEEKRFTDSNTFEGIVSVRTVVENMQKYSVGETENDRRIISCMYDIKNTDSKEYKWLCHRAEEFGFGIELKSREEIDEISVGNSHGGLISYCTGRTIPELSTAKIKQNGFYVMLEGIEDPYNFGYALRSLYAAGADGVILSQRNWFSAAGVVCRSSAGASEMIDVYTSDPVDAIGIMRKAGCKTVCADIRDSVPIYDADLKLPLFLIIGGEKRGITRSVIDSADIRVRIGYGRDFRASLSAASAAAVAGFEIYRQNRKI